MKPTSRQETLLKRTFIDFQQMSEVVKAPLIFEKGEGLYLWDIEGKRYLELSRRLDAGEFRLLLVDQRGQGLSGPAAEETWTIERMALDVSELAASLGLRQYAVLGHSFGAFVALQHAVDYPGAAARMCARATPVPPSTPPPGCGQRRRR